MRTYIYGGLALFVALLIGALLWLRADLVKAKADAKQWKANAETFQQANERNLKTIELYKVARKQNDALTEELTVEIARLNARGVKISNNVKEAIRNDPQASDWANTAVPDSLRDASHGR
jgi:hypothetical protein